LRTEVSDNKILETLENLIGDQTLYQLMRKSASTSDLRSGKAHVVNKILEILEK
jgi:hypothetical protein